MKNKVVLFDIDYTLFNVGAYKENIFLQLQKYFPDVNDFLAIARDTYTEIRKDGWFDVTRYTNQLLTHVASIVDKKVLEDIWSEPMLLSDSIYPEAMDVLKDLTQQGVTLGIFSSGVVAFQKSKIAILSHFFQETNIHIYGLKDQNLSEVLQMYKNETIILIDDFIPVIEKAKQEKGDLIAIWIKRGKFGEHMNPSENFSPDFTEDDLQKIPHIVASI